MWFLLLLELVDIRDGNLDRGWVVSLSVEKGGLDFLAKVVVDQLFLTSKPGLSMST